MVVSLTVIIFEKSSWYFRYFSESALQESDQTFEEATFGSLAQATVIQPMVFHDSGGGGLVHVSSQNVSAQVFKRKPVPHEIYIDLSS